MSCRHSDIARGHRELNSLRNIKSKLNSMVSDGQRLVLSLESAGSMCHGAFLTETMGMLDAELRARNTEIVRILENMVDQVEFAMNRLRDNISDWEDEDYDWHNDDD